ncbi:hypothetical protein J1614_005129 [Plenodomus biglobosus]|nr:hypothetical protein J1614_005129 [Plenodomus biglobosus]
MSRPPTTDNYGRPCCCLTHETAVCAMAGQCVAGRLWRCISHSPPARYVVDSTQDEARDARTRARENGPAGRRASRCPKKQASSTSVENSGSFVKASELPNQGREVVGALQVELSVLKMGNAGSDRSRCHWEPVRENTIYCHMYLEHCRRAASKQTWSNADTKRHPLNLRSNAITPLCPRLRQHVPER